jgi:two-component system response regulator (stage 0 sporulation protein F)
LTDRGRGGTKVAVGGIVDSSSRVLIVDDNLALAENIAEIFELEGFGSLVFGTAEDALQGAIPERVSVLVTDYRLPGIDGIELIKRVRRERRDVSCILISAHGDDRVVSSAEVLGARFLAKPVDVPQLVGLVRSLGC